MSVRKMIINAVDEQEVRIAIVRDGILEDLEVETVSNVKNKGNIYKARVIAVEPALNAAFVDYGAEKQGFLTANDVDPKLSEKKPGRGATIDQLLKPNQEILVQIDKDEVGSKGAVLSTFLSLAGRYLVLMPGSKRHGVSRRVADEDERRELLDAAAQLDVPEDMGVIVRTAGTEKGKEDLDRDLNVLLRLWDRIKKSANNSKAPSLLHKEQDSIIRALRDYYAADIDEVIVDADESFDQAQEYVDMVMPDQRRALTRYVEPRPIFHHYLLEEQIEKIYERRVELDGGGSLVIEPTEALVSIDVNSGKQKEKGQEETALRTNLAAAHEIARQIKLRDLGGIIVVDFIDMQMRKNRTAVEKAMKEAVRSDKARIKIGHISPNGTLELTRQRIRTALRTNVFETCGQCKGTGHVLTAEAHATRVMRRIHDRASRADLLSVNARLPPGTANHLKTAQWTLVEEMMKRHRIKIDFTIDHALASGESDYAFETDPSATPIIPPEPDFGPVELPEDELAAAQNEDPESPDQASAAEDSMETQTSNSGGRRRRRPRSRSGGNKNSASKKTGFQAASPEETEQFDLPTFELVDPKTISFAETSDDSDESNGRRRSKARRRKKTRKPGLSARDGASTQVQQPTQTAAAGGNPIKSFFKKLFGG